MIKRAILIQVFLISVFFDAFPQRLASHLVKEADSLSKKLPQQLAYIQTSKGIYETGEDLWFKVYLMDSQYLTPSVRDTILYVQLLQKESKKIVLQEKYPINNGFANGNLLIRDTIPPGDYILAAYSPHTFLRGQNEFKAFRKIRIMKRVQPKMVVTAQYKELDSKGKKQIELEVQAKSDRSPAIDVKKSTEYCCSNYTPAGTQPTIEMFPVETSVNISHFFP